MATSQTVGIQMLFVAEFITLLFSVRTEDCITDLKALDQYLKEQEEKEYRNQLGSGETSPGSGPSFWNYNRSLTDYTPVLRKYQYQIACRSPQSTKSPDNDPDDPATYRGDEVSWLPNVNGLQSLPKKTFR